MSNDQFDMFATQPDVLPREPASYKPDPDRVRRKLSAVLNEMKSAEVMPWNRKIQALHRQVFPQMTRALPDDEANRFRLAFEAEWQRLS